MTMDVRRSSFVSGARIQRPTTSADAPRYSTFGTAARIAMLIHGAAAAAQTITAIHCRRRRRSSGGNAASTLSSRCSRS